jgi:hypothetical protein
MRRIFGRILAAIYVRNSVAGCNNMHGSEPSAISGSANWLKPTAVFWRTFFRDRKVCAIMPESNNIRDIAPFEFALSLAR